MKCQNCGKNEANTHLRQNINGNTSEYYLCSECAEKLGYGGMFSGFGSFGSFGGFGGLNMFGSLLDSMFGGIGAKSLGSATKCKKCGSTFSDITERGMVGCADCYDTFRDRLMPSIERMQGAENHVGKRSKTTNSKPAKTAEKEEAALSAASSKEREVAALKAKMAKAVEVQDYEQAAVLRDKIKELEASK